MTANSSPTAATVFHGKLQRTAILYGFALLAGVFAIEQAGKSLQLGTPLTAALVVAWLAGIPYAWSRLHVPWNTVQSYAVVIAAPPTSVWSTIVPRPTDDFYRATVSRIEAVSGACEAYRFHLRKLGPACVVCGLPPAPVESGVRYTLEIVEKIENKRLVTRSVGRESGTRAISHGGATVWQIESNGDGSLVTYSAITRRPALWYWASSLATGSNLARNILVDLKGHLEGTPARGSFAAGREWLAAARAARQHCSCKSGTPNDGIKTSG